LSQVSLAEGPFSVALFSASSYSVRLIHVWAFFEHLTSASCENNVLLNGEFSDGPLTSFPYFVFDNLPFIECRETGLLDGRNVHER
jgi:hypothetical protein